MQIYSTNKNHRVYKETNDVIRSGHDLILIKKAINVSMRLAIIYIALFIIFILVLAMLVARGASIGRAALSLFIFGIVTLPIGLIGKKYEKRIKSMQVDCYDPEVVSKFQQYLKQWDEPRFQLPD